MRIAILTLTWECYYSFFSNIEWEHILNRKIFNRANFDNESPTTLTSQKNYNGLKIPFFATCNKEFEN